MMENIERLRGKNLACWCALDQPCHADVLLKLANSPVEFDKIITGDSLEEMKRLPDGVVDLIVTSPPYPGQLGNDQTADEWLVWMAEIATEMRRVLNPFGVLAFNVMFKRTANGWFDTRLFGAVPAMLEAAGFNMIDIYIYGKSNPPPNGSLRHSDIPAWEPVFVCTLSPDIKSYRFDHARRPYAEKSIRSDGTLCTSRSTTAAPNADGAKQTNLMVMSSSADQSRPRARGQSFPLELPERFIRQHTAVGDVVLDPFSGAGTTCRMAQKLGRRYIGIEISSSEAEVARKWLRRPYQKELL